MASPFCVLYLTTYIYFPNCERIHPSKIVKHVLHERPGLRGDIKNLRANVEKLSLRKVEKLGVKVAARKSVGSD